ncbi:MAG: YdcF family protein [Bacteroidota bacterium]
MFFILSKLLFFLLIPFTWIMILLVWIYFTKSRELKRRLTIITISITIIFTNPWLYKKATLSWQTPKKNLSAQEQYETGILLTGMVQFDKYNKGYFGTSADRFIQTATLYHTGKIKKILVTGASGSLLHGYPAEAEYLKNVLLNNAVPEKDIIIEPLSRNTYENAIFSKKIIDSFQLKPPFLLITSALHMPRSSAVFKKASISFVTYPCDYKVVEEKISFDEVFMPDAKLLKSWSELLKELIGLAAYKLTGKA